MKKALLSVILLFFIAAQQLTAQTNYWTKIYDTPNHGLDKATAVTTDANCYVYVTGTSEGVSSGLDYLTIKYDVDGSIMWSQRYDGTAGGDDVPAAIQVDAVGNVYVTGKSQGTGIGYDYATIKYNAGGTEVWTKRFNNTNTGGNGDDIAVALFVDALGQNVYVGGYSHNYSGPGTGNDFVIYKYAAANGNAVWGSPAVYSYSNISAAVEDNLVAMAVDGSGNVFATGSSDNVGQYKVWSTVKFNSSGVQTNLTNTSNNGGAPFDLAIDNTGNVYVIGGDPSQFDVSIKSYSPSLSSFNTNWTTHINNDLGFNTGFYYDGGKIKVTSNAIYLFFNADYDATFGVFNYDVLTAKLNLTGDTVWTKRFGGAGTKNDKGSSMAIDATGNIYITGYTTNANNDKDVFINKYATASGAITSLPTTPYNGTANSDDEGAQIIVTPEKNILVTGYTTGSSSQEDFITFKYISNSLPNAAAGSDVATCLGTAVTIGSALTAGYNYLWSPSNTLNSATVSNPSATPTVPTTYHLTVTLGCATAFDSVTVDTLHCITGIDDIPAFVQVNLYPNPASNQLFIETNGTPVSEVNIYNTTGAVVSQTKQPQSKSIDISGLANGVYIAEVKSKEASVKRRWVKM